MIDRNRRHLRLIKENFSHLEEQEEESEEGQKKTEATQDLPDIEEPDPPQSPIEASLLKLQKLQEKAIQEDDYDRGRSFSTQETIDTQAEVGREPGTSRSEAQHRYRCTKEPAPLYSGIGAVL
ncbi:UNVERIFIED_CONTAM: hypothetical protein FKN15_007321 [Acipenser sinensis]